MNKKEKEIAAMYLSGCLNEARIAEASGDESGKAQAYESYLKYKNRIKALLEEKFELFGLDYEASVQKPMSEIFQIATVFYRQRVNGEQMKYPA